MEGRRAALLQEVGPRPVESAMTPKEDLQVELGSDNQEVRNQEAQESQLHLPASLSSWASQAKATPEEQPSSSQQNPVSSDDSYLKAQESLQALFTNQRAVLNIVFELKNLLGTIEDRVQAIEQQMSTFAQFNKEIDQLGDETNFNGIAFYP